MTSLCRFGRQLYRFFISFLIVSAKTKFARDAIVCIHFSIVFGDRPRMFTFARFFFFFFLSLNILFSGRSWIIGTNFSNFICCSRSTGYSADSDRLKMNRGQIQARTDGAQWRNRGVHLARTREMPKHSYFFNYVRFLFYFFYFLSSCCWHPTTKQTEWKNDTLCYHRLFKTIC